MHLICIANPDLFMFGYTLQVLVVSRPPVYVSSNASLILVLATVVFWYGSQFNCDFDSGCTFRYYSGSDPCFVYDVIPV